MILLFVHAFAKRGRDAASRVQLAHGHQQNLQPVPDGTRSYAMVPGSRITSRVPSYEIQVFPTIFCAVFAVSDGTRWYPTVPERGLDHFADATLLLKPPHNQDRDPPRGSVTRYRFHPRRLQYTLDILC